MPGSSQQPERDGGKRIAAPPRQAEVVAAHGRNVLVECEGSELVQCLTRGKNASIACGDLVMIAPSGDGLAVIESVCPRQSLFYRSAAHREKLIAANATQLILVVATEPSFSDELVMRAVAAAEFAGMTSLIVLNKSDLAVKLEPARDRLASFVNAGYRVIEISALGDLQPLVSLLRGHKNVLAGQSGMGKSTLINGLCPGETAATQSISHFLASGRHTTTATRLYRIDADTSIIDSPGMQEFGLAHMNRANIEASMPEFRPYRGQCRFQNCRHGPEPGCALIEAVEQGHIDARRFELFQRIAGSVPG